MIFVIFFVMNRDKKNTIHDQKITNRYFFNGPNNAYTPVNPASCLLRMCTEIERVVIQGDTTVKLSVYT